MDWQTAVVTGANCEDGVGLALVHDLVRRGLQLVVGTYREPSRSSALLELAEQDSRVFAAPLDVQSAQSVDAFGEWCRVELGHVDLLVNNAGTSAPRASITDAPISELEEALRVHGVGMLQVTRALLPLMREGSVVVNISSTLGSIPNMGRHSTYYDPAKALQNVLTRQFAPGLQDRGIVLLGVHPGWVATSMGGEGAPISPEDSARALADMMFAARPEDAGTLGNLDGTPLP